MSTASGFTGHPLDQGLWEGYRSYLRPSNRIKPHAMRVVHYPLLPILWSDLAGDGSASSIIHKAHSRGLWRDRNWVQRLPIFGKLLLWPFVIGVLAAWSTRRRGAAVRREHGVGILMQLVQQFQVAAAHGILPPWYYMFDLYDPDRRAQAASYLHRCELKGGLYKALRRKDVGVPQNAMSNKVLFADWCERHALPHAPLILVFHEGRLTWAADPQRLLPPVDIFGKRLNGRGGKGAERWDFVADGQYRSPDGEMLSTEQLVHRFSTLSRDKGYLIQPRMVNHPAIADLSNGALVTVRVMTFRNETGGYEPTEAVIRMARGANRTVDNFHAGGIAAKVDIASGIIGRATDMGLRPQSRWHDVHPDTGAQIAGRKLPMLDEILALAVRAHGVFRDRVAIGWDIAPLADGPCLIEGNGSPDLDVMQRCHREGLGARRSSALLSFHILDSPVLTGLF